MKHIRILVCLGMTVLMLAFAACSGTPASSTPAPADKTYTVGICQLVQHEALDAATEGFCAALTEKLGDKVKFLKQNASGDPATCAVICNQFVGEEVDLILANATPALQAAQSATNKIPVLGTSITDYGAALSISDWKGYSETNISGTSDRVLESEQAKVLQDLFPDSQKVGILYCSSEANSKVQADAFRAAAEEMGYVVTEFKFADSNDVAQVTQTACDESDVIYIPTDNTAASNTELINNVALNAKTPVLAGEENICRGCGIATLSISYYDLGYVTGEMAYEILAGGADVAKMEVRYAPFQRKYNPSLCEVYGITVSEDYTALD